MYTCACVFMLCIYSCACLCVCLYSCAYVHCACVCACVCFLYDFICVCEEKKRTNKQTYDLSYFCYCFSEGGTKAKAWHWKQVRGWRSSNEPRRRRTHLSSGWSRTVCMSWCTCVWIDAMCLYVCLCTCVCIIWRGGRQMNPYHPAHISLLLRVIIHMYVIIQCVSLSMCIGIMCEWRSSNEPRRRRCYVHCCCTPYLSGVMFVAAVPPIKWLFLLFQCARASRTATEHSDWIVLFPFYEPSQAILFRMKILAFLNYYYFNILFRMKIRAFLNHYFQQLFRLYHDFFFFFFFVCVRLFETYDIIRSTQAILFRMKIRLFFNYCFFNSSFVCIMFSSSLFSYVSVCLKYDILLLFRMYMSLFFWFFCFSICFWNIIFFSSLSYVYLLSLKYVFLLFFFFFRMRPGFLILIFIWERNVLNAALSLLSFFLVILCLINIF